jgi:hypothetical protein
MQHRRARIGWPCEIVERQSRVVAATKAARIQNRRDSHIRTSTEVADSCCASSEADSTRPCQQAKAGGPGRAKLERRSDANDHSIAIRGVRTQESSDDLRSECRSTYSGLSTLATLKEGSQDTARVVVTSLARADTIRVNFHSE